ncbi:GntR family transcriptional regulator [Ignavigranum ruoffiae]|uniref:GntR family transcriptional regulator n=1 Tax=Ignavigranum ruoffiae TaxID=89093 RepID=UPI0023529419|nr:GntR family transcriptional regulator [Ignavigranum ruoffiae]
MKFDAQIPIYQQLIHQFKLAFVRGAYQPGASLPSRREIAQQLKINPNTVQKAFKEMEEQALIVTQANVPSQLTTDPERLAKLREEMVSRAVSQFVKEIRAMHISRQEAIEYLNKAEWSESIDDQD